MNKYCKTLLMSAMGQVGDDSLFLMDYALRLLRVLILLSLWRTILAGKGEVGGLTLGATLTYTLISEAFADQLQARTDLAWTLKDGSIVTRFLRPLGLAGQYASEMMGRWLLGLALYTLPLILAAPLLGVNPAPASPAAAVLFVVSMALSVSVGLAVEFLFGALMVFFEQSTYAIERVRVVIGTLLSGALVPLAFFPWGIGDLFQWLPFASMASAPLRIYTGTGDPLTLILVQVAWSVLLWPISQWLWNVHRERLVSLGG